MITTTTHMYKHVQDLHELSDAIFKKPTLKSFGAYNDLCTLSKPMRWDVIAAFVKDATAEQNITDYLDLDQHALVGQVMTGEEFPETLYDALWKESRIDIEEAYEEAVEVLFAFINSEYAARRADDNYSSFVDRIANTPNFAGFNNKSIAAQLNSLTIR